MLLPRTVQTLFAAAILVGCGGSGEQPGTSEDMNASTNVQTTQSPSGAARDACELILAAEIEAIVGEAVVARPTQRRSPSETGCTYVRPRGESGIPFLDLTVYWSGGRAQWENRQGGLRIATDLMQAAEPDVDVDSVIGADPLAGIGDAAHYGGIIPSTVLSGDVLIEFMMFGLPDDDEHFPALARSALSRLYE